MAVERRPTMMDPPVEDLLDRVDSKFTLVTLAAKRGRQINSYFNQLGEGLGAIVPPSRGVQAERLRRRGDPPEKIEHRLALADTEEDLGRQLADHVVVNDDLDRAVAEVAGIVKGHRTRVSGD